MSDHLPLPKWIFNDKTIATSTEMAAPPGFLGSDCSFMMLPVCWRVPSEFNSDCYGFQVGSLVWLLWRTLLAPCSDAGVVLTPTTSRCRLSSPLLVLVLVCQRPRRRHPLCRALERMPCLMLHLSLDARSAGFRWGAAFSAETPHIGLAGKPGGWQQRLLLKRRLLVGTSTVLLLAMLRDVAEDAVLLRRLRGRQS